MCQLAMGAPPFPCFCLGFGLAAAWAVGELCIWLMPSSISLPFGHSAAAKSTAITDSFIMFLKLFCFAVHNVYIDFLALILSYGKPCLYPVPVGSFSLSQVRTF